MKENKYKAYMVCEVDGKKYIQVRSKYFATTIKYITDVEFVKRNVNNDVIRSGVLTLYLFEYSEELEDIVKKILDMKLNS